MPKPKTTYRSYLLRLWREEEAGIAWRVMLESVTNPGQRHYFKDLESLKNYLFTQQDAESFQAESDQ